MRFGFSFVVVALLVACSEAVPTPTIYSMNIEALDSRGIPIAGIEVSVGGIRIGKTGPKGHLHARVAAFDGQRFGFRGDCPEGFSSAALPQEIVFHETRGLDGEKNSHLFVPIRCERIARVIALLVSADGHAGIQVLIDGLPAAKTDFSGFAHIRLERKPNSEFEVSLDSSKWPDLLPSNPRRRISVGTEDAVHIFDAMFTSKKRSRRIKKRKPKRIVPSEEKTLRPIRIGGRAEETRLWFGFDIGACSRVRVGFFGYRRKYEISARENSIRGGVVSQFVCYF